MNAIANIGRKVVAATVEAPEATMLHPNIPVQAAPVVAPAPAVAAVPVAIPAAPALCAGLVILV